MDNRYCVIMAGGVGSRFWPLSVEGHPKQFMDILGTGKSFIRQTYERFLPIVKSENIYVVTNAAYKELVRLHIPELNDNQILLEPMRKNTAPCIAYATYKIKAMCSDAVVMVTPADHFVTNESEFCEVLKESCEFASANDALMTIGITPVRAETGYGYIQKGESFSGNISKVKTFTEKPNLELANEFLKSGEFLWNSGIFVWRTDSILNAFAKLQPDINALFELGAEFYNTSQEQEFINSIFMQCKNISIDYGIMERSDNVYVSTSKFGWSDIGTWGSLYEFSSKDENGNAGKVGNINTFDTKDCLISLPKGKRAVIEGLEGYIVAESKDTLLICRKEKEQNIKIYSEVCENNGKKG